MTIKEVAKLAGVSPAAVSRFLNGGSISEEKRERVRKAMRIDYFDDRRIVKEWEALLKEAQPRGGRR